MIKGFYLCVYITTLEHFSERNNEGRIFAKHIFWGKGFAKIWLICFGGNSDLRPQEGSGEECGAGFTGFLGRV